MEITQVKIFPVQEDKLKAFVSVVFDQCFMVNDIKVIQGKDGLFLSMPSRRKKTGEFKDVAHPLNNEMRRRLEEEVLNEYRHMVDDPTPRRPDRDDEGEPDVAVAAVAAVAASPPAHVPHVPMGQTLPATAAAAAPAGEQGNGERPATTVSGAPGTATDTATKEESEAALERQKTLEEVQEMHLSDSFWSVS